MDTSYAVDQLVSANELVNSVIDKCGSIGAIDLTVSTSAEGDEVVHRNFNFQYGPLATPEIVLESLLGILPPDFKRMREISGVISYSE